MTSRRTQDPSSKPRTWWSDASNGMKASTSATPQALRYHRAEIALTPCRGENTVANPRSLDGVTACAERLGGNSRSG